MELLDESHELEYKVDFPQNQQILKTVVAFVNGFGGRLIIGIDNKKKIIGIDPKIIQEKMEYLHKMIYEELIPTIIPQIFIQKISDKHVLIIECARGIKKPYFIKSKGVKEGTYIRVGRSTVLADENTLKELEWQGRGIFLDETPQYFTSIDDLDIKKVQSFLKQKKITLTKMVNEKLLTSYGLIYGDNKEIYLTIAGNLLFGKTPEKYLPEAFILCSHFKGNSGRDAIASITCTGNLFEQLDKSYQFIIKNLGRSYQIKATHVTPKRKEKLEIPPLAIREALINAIVHRNYFISGPIKIAIYDDRVEIFSPGGFPGPIVISELGNGVTYIRNHALSKIFFEMGIIEKLGSGFATIFSEYEKYKLMRPIFIDGGNFIKAILPRKKQNILLKNNKNVNKDKNKKEDDTDDFNSITKIKKLFFIKQSWSISEIVEETQMAKSTIGLILKNLVVNKFLIMKGRGPSTRYVRS
ncbi:MAG: putative DNA binding domain-containing protein [Oligoflexia bacterium]|nr:putative DNA binding domain-containing protein [Oligoflexia bacterium]